LEQRCGNAVVADKQIEISSWSCYNEFAMQVVNLHCELNLEILAQPPQRLIPEFGCDAAMTHFMPVK
jgi:hypothetical protein